jgi:hypothetical protein
VLVAVGTVLCCWLLYKHKHAYFGEWQSQHSKEPPKSKSFIKWYFIFQTWSEQSVALIAYLYVFRWPLLCSFHFPLLFSFEKKYYALPNNLQNILSFWCKQRERSNNNTAVVLLFVFTPNFSFHPQYKILA